MKKFWYSIVCILITTSALAQKKAKPSAVKQDGPALDAIKEADLKTDLYAMASDHFRGREAGTLDELKVSAWWAEEARKAGLQPAGDDGSFFQFFSIYRNRISPASTITIGGNYLDLWKDVLIAQTTVANINATVVYVGKGTKEDLDKADLRGKAVAIDASPEGIALNVSIPERRYPTYILNKFRTEVINRGAVAIIFIADALGEKSWSQVAPAMRRGFYDVEGGPNASISAKPPVLWMHSSAQDVIARKKVSINISLQVESFLYPSVNIVGVIEGKDKTLKQEYVLFSGHQDHDGVRQPYGEDSIYNGADDNASVSVALMAIARAFKKNPGKRSALFVWHGAEERGLLGSKWYSSHPTVPAAGIVAVLNGDMIGSNDPDSAALLGVQLPHRNSADLVAMALEANNEGPRFKLDTLWDKPSHVEGWYFRSDHLPFARAGFPAIFYTTLLHPNYHTPMDEAAAIDYKKLTRMTEWIYRTGWKVANAAARPMLDDGFKLER